MWWKLKRHRLATICGFILFLNYGSIFISEIVAPYDLHNRNIDYIYAPPQAVHLFHEGKFVGPFVYGWNYRLDMETFSRIYKPDTTKVQPLRFFCAGDAYKFWGLYESDFHFVCPPEDGTFFLLGTDRLGRDMFSRITYGARISLTIGIIGIIISFALGIILGGIAGYYGGFIDSAIQRLMEIIRSFPELPLWMALVGSITGDLESDPGIFRHHGYSGIAGLGRSGAGRAFQIVVPA